MESSEHELLLPVVKEENICLPLSVNAVCRYWNIEIPLSGAVEISKKYHSVDGSILIEGIELAERHGLECSIIHSSIPELKRIIDLGIPPIVIFPGVQSTIQHASVISGYDPKERTIFHYIPQIDTKGEFQIGVIPQEKFDELWAEDGRVMIVIAPPDVISGLKNLQDERVRANRLCFESERLDLLNYTSNAVDSLKEAIQIDPENPTAYSLMGAILNKQNSSECVKYYQKCIELNPRSFLSFRGLGNYYLKTKEYDKAEEFYSKAISINPIRYGPIYKNRGIVRLQLDKKRDAKDDFESYLKYTPKAADRDSVLQAIKELDAECGI